MPKPVFKQRIGSLLLKNTSIIPIDEWKGENVEGIYVGMWNNKPLYIGTDLYTLKPDVICLLYKNLGLINYTINVINNFG